MSSLISLECQLLCACGCAYNIDNTTGVYTSPAGDPFGPAIGWATGVPTAIVGGDVNENAALVGLINLTINNTPTEAIVIAYQGTLPPALNITSVIDWLTDFTAKPVSASPKIPGLVHSGILQDVNDTLEAVVNAVQALQNASPGLPVYITGHSKGAGQASITAALFNAGIPVMIAPAAVYTFASPMIGNQDFVNGFSQNIPVYRFENYLDIVPFMAPSADFIAILKANESFIDPFTYDLDAIVLLFETFAGNWGYVPLGTLQYITGSTITNPATNPCAVNIAQALAQNKPGLQMVAAAHSHLCGAGYMNGTCNNSGVCPVGSN
ncbi:MAG: lipase family protein [Ferruginibacter sp.]|nr:lipase family protein [Ferruginibacter sp.]